MQQNPRLCTEIWKLLLPWQQGGSEASFNNAIKLADAENNHFFMTVDFNMSYDRAIETFVLK